MAIHGFADARFLPVRDCFADIAAAQAGTGAALAAYCAGRLVVDLRGGYPDQDRRRPWDARSLVQPYSVSKPFAAVCALRLVQARRLDLDAPMQRYWPEFRTPATVRHVLSHQAGVVTLDHPAPAGIFYDWARLCRLVAMQEPSWAPGTAHGESALFYGLGGLGGSYGGASTAGGYTIGFVTGTVGSHDRAERAGERGPVLPWPAGSAGYWSGSVAGPAGLGLSR